MTNAKRREVASAWSLNADGEITSDNESQREAYSRRLARTEAARLERRIANHEREFPRPVLVEDTSRSVRSDDAYVKVWNQLQVLNAECARLDRECAELQSSVTTAANTSLAAAFDARARALIAGDNPDVIGVEQLRGTLAATRDKAAVTRRAREFLRAKVDEARAAASREIVARVTPEYRELIGDMAAALITLGKMIEREREFFDVLRLGDVMTSELRAMPLPALGRPADRQSRVAAWLIEALQNELIERSAIPREWLKKWEGA